MSNLNYQQNVQNTRVCEVCGSVFLTGYGYSLMACWTVTGHAYVGAFSCPHASGNQHWGCCPEHAIEATLACIEEHMHPLLLTKHQEAEEKGYTRAAVGDEYLLERGENFHILGPQEKTQPLEWHMLRNIQGGKKC